MKKIALDRRDFMRKGLTTTAFSVGGLSSNHTTPASNANLSNAKAGHTVKDYGAIGDGSTDDTDSIQQALDALSTAGVPVLTIPAGNYRITRNLILPNRAGIRIHGVEGLTSLYGDYSGLWSFILYNQ